MGPAKGLELPSFEVLERQTNTTPNLHNFTNSSHKIQFNPQLFTMAGRRIAYVGLPVAAIGGYYFYAAGGDSKVAQKKAERLFTDNRKGHVRLQANMI